MLLQVFQIFFMNMAHLSYIERSEIQAEQFDLINKIIHHMQEKAIVLVNDNIPYFEQGLQNLLFIKIGFISRDKRFLYNLFSKSLNNASIPSNVSLRFNFLTSR